jgi:hypothetical protein
MPEEHCEAMRLEGCNHSAESGNPASLPDKDFVAAAPMKSELV